MSDQALSHRDVMPRVLGVDACKKGWVGITNDAHGYFGSSIKDLIQAALDDDGPLEVTAIDIPIGLPNTGPRQADTLARKQIGKRASSVFPTPVRAALTATSHSEATAISVQSTGKGLSQQAYALGRKILEVDEWAQSAPNRVIEIHPEVSFAVMNNGPLQHSKSSWAGFYERCRILAESGITVPSEIGFPGEMAGTDDVLDAAAALWTALRFADGVAISYPTVPERFGDGHEAAIWA